jgi:hypothetical protein
VRQPREQVAQLPVRDVPELIPDDDADLAAAMPQAA